VHSWTEAGKTYSNAGLAYGFKDQPYDIKVVKPRITEDLWITALKDANGHMFYCAYFTKEQAKKGSFDGFKRVACQGITFDVEEGEGL
jgi:hypothetical protein